jgi:hypothetical protein
MDNDKRIKLLENFGIEVSKIDIIKNYITHKNYENEFIGRFFKYQLSELIIELNNIKNHDRKSFDRYIKNINKSSGGVNFWGEKFELYFHSKLLQGVPVIFNSIRRGKDGYEPDFLISVDNAEIGVELTTSQFEKTSTNDYRSLEKIRDKIIEKNGKCYAKNNCMLVVNITNLKSNSVLNNFELDHEIQLFLTDKTNLTNNDLNFGAIYLVRHVFTINKEKIIGHDFKPILCILKDVGEVNPQFKKLNNILFPYKKESDENIIDYEIFAPFV